ncbi:3-deoxy-8-phosphooctulonate synthase [Candidatus Dependentiae bacterium]|nr:3-deoxy-8-phosphooctulonate synthase [Candidatus Dependentiae bacterium]
MNREIENRIERLKKIEANDNPLFFILGPCVIENESHCLKIAEFLKTLSIKLKFNFIFKSSYDKANRTAIQNYRGIGLYQGLKILDKIRSQLEIPIITDVHDITQISDVAEVVDILQIPAFLSRQTDLLVAAGNTGKIIHVKKGQFLNPESMKQVVAKVKSTGNVNIWICERGYVFGYNNLIVDYRNFPIMKKIGSPIVFDATHSVQRPGGQGCSSGGDRNFVSNLAVAAVAQSIAGIFMEVHDEPEKALCDGPNSIRLSQLEDLLKYLIDLDSWIKSRKIPNVN